MSQNQTHIYGVSLPPAVAYRARIVAATQGKSRSGLMRDLLMDYLKRCDSHTDQRTDIQVDLQTQENGREGWIDVYPTD